MLAGNAPRRVTPTDVIYRRHREGLAMSSAAEAATVASDPKLAVLHRFKWTLLTEWHQICNVKLLLNTF